MRPFLRKKIIRNCQMVFDTIIRYQIVNAIANLVCIANLVPYLVVITITIGILAKDSCMGNNIIFGRIQHC